jgi:hypothetical protein
VAEERAFCYRLTSLEGRYGVQFSVNEDTLFVLHNNTFSVQPPVKSGRGSRKGIHPRDDAQLHRADFIARETIEVDSFVNMIAPGEAKRPGV